MAQKREQFSAVGKLAGAEERDQLAGIREMPLMKQCQQLRAIFKLVLAKSVLRSAPLASLSSPRV